MTYPQEHHHPVLSPLRITDDMPVGAPPAPESPPASGPWTSRGPEQRDVRPDDVQPHGIRPYAVRPYDDPPPF